jgi:dihydroorotate dehydrogenase electron transfer subunit
MLAGFDRADLAAPTVLLPPAVEFQVASGGEALSELSALLHDTIPWADKVCGAGGGALYSRLAAVIAEVRLGLRPGLAYVSVAPPMACGVGVCGACTVETRDGPRQACRHGPVFDLAELVM